MGGKLVTERVFLPCTITFPATLMLAFSYRSCLVSFLDTFSYYPTFCAIARKKLVPGTYIALTIST